MNGILKKILWPINVEKKGAYLGHKLTVEELNECLKQIEKESFFLRYWLLLLSITDAVLIVFLLINT